MAVPTGLLFIYSFFLFLITMQSFKHYKLVICLTVFHLTTFHVPIIMVFFCFNFCSFSQLNDLPKYILQKISLQEA